MPKASTFESTTPGPPPDAAKRPFWHRLILAPHFPRRPERDDRELAHPPAELQKKIVADYFSQLTGSVASVRSRAQGGYTIAAAIAAAIITAGVLGNIGDRRLVTQVAAGIGLLLWLTTVVLYAQAVAGHVITPPTDDYDLAKDALYEAAFEKAVLEQRLDWALYTTILAVAATIIAVFFALIFPKPDVPERQPGQISLTASGAQAVKPVCGRETETLRGSYDADDLDKPFVSVELATDPQALRDCPNGSGKTIQIRSRDIQSATQTE